VAQEWPQPAAIREVNASANQRTFLIFVFIPVAEFWDVIGTKVFRVFLLAIHSYLDQRILLPTPLRKTGLKLVFNVNIGYRNLKSENSQDNICPEASTKLYVHESGFW
jgi:hypothetical protein